MRYFAMLLLGLLGTACSRDGATGSPSPIWSEQDASQRTPLPMAFDTVWRIGGEADTTLLQPMWLSAGSEGVTVWDEGRKAIVRISREGGVLWSFGREGDGPGEFRSVRGIAHLPDGRVAVVDNASRRLTIIDANGRMTGEVGMELDAFDVAGLPDGGMVVSTGDDPAFLLFDESGAPAGVLGFPHEGYSHLSLFSRQGRVQRTDEGWVFGFTAGNGWWRFGEDGGDAEGFPYAEHTDFPEVRTVVSRSVENGVTRTTRSTRAAAYVSSALSFGARGDTLFVHYGGQTEYRRRTLDLFGLSNGAYLGSVRLPFASSQLAVGPDRVYALGRELFPALIALTLNPQGAESR